MIVSKRGQLSIEGTKAELMTDLTCIIKTLRDDAEFTEEDIAGAIEYSRKTSDELRADAHELFRKKYPMLSAFFDALEHDLKDKEE